MAIPSPVTPTVDFDRDGKQHGFLRLPWSRDDSAWGSIPIPICVIKNGPGPTALLVGGNHGDEYEGPVSLLKAAAELAPAAVTGRVIILPCLNFPAVQAGTRISPIDKGNMNRSFPGRPNGTVTEKIADYVERHLLPLSDIVLDIHSGGRTLEFLPFAACHRLPDKAQEARAVAAMQAFGAPYGMLMLELDSAGMLDTSVEAMGKIFVTTELGGGGSLTANTLAIAERGLRNLLIHAGILAGRIEPAPSRLLDMADGDCFVIGADRGLIEPCVDLGSPVAAGELVARIHDYEHTGRPAAAYHAKRGGILAGRHFPGRVQPGDCLAVIAALG
jgi:N-alpha-acetyl-L-2,4-diaminobutyrate deacetylase